MSGSGTATKQPVATSQGLPELTVMGICMGGEPIDIKGQNYGHKIKVAATGVTLEVKCTESEMRAAPQLGALVEVVAFVTVNYKGAMELQLKSINPRPSVKG